MATKNNDPVPRFFLYGEKEEETKADEQFIHAETLERRSRPNEWLIRPHSHADLHHIFVVAKGGGEFLVGRERLEHVAPSLLLVPAGEVHGFTWLADSQGHVVTFGGALLRRLARREAALGALFAAPNIVRLNSRTNSGGTDCLRLASRLDDETRGDRVGRSILVEAALTALLVHACRAAKLWAGGGVAARGPRAALVARYRDLIEARFRDGLRVSGFAEELGVTVGRLRAACMAVTGRPPVHLLHERLLAEAKRGLLQGDAPVAEIAFQLGFTDPAYFNRFFTSRVGCSPGRFRRGAAG